MRSLRAFNNALLKRGIQVELVKGDGYFYFMSTNLTGIVADWNLDSIYVNHYSQLSSQHWLTIFNDVVLTLSNAE